MEHSNLWNMLEKAAASSVQGGIVHFAQGDRASDRTEIRYQYRQLFKEARLKSQTIVKELFFIHKPIQHRVNAELEMNRIVVLHFDSPFESIVWFWAVIAAGGIPCLSSPFKGNHQDRHRYIMGLRKLLENPLMITTSDLFPLFPSRKKEFIRLTTVKELLRPGYDKSVDYVTPTFAFPGATRTLDDMAMIMLTSGSSGQPKAVGLKHGQILRSLQGKSRMQ